MRAHQAGQITAFDISPALDGDFGDAGKAAMLERRVERLRRQVTEAAEIMAPRNQAPADPLEAAQRAAHQAFAEHTRAMLAGAAAQGAPRREPRPFGSSGVAVRADVTCQQCAKVGATPEQSYLIHSDPDAPAGVAVPPLTEAELAKFGRESGVPYRPGGAARSQDWETPWRAQDAGGFRSEPPGP